MSNEEGNFGDTSSGDVITVTIKTLQGDNDDYQIKLTDTVQSLINKYSADKNLSGNHAKVGFSLKGATLQPNSTFKDVGVEDNDVIHALIRLQGGF